MSVKVYIFMKALMTTMKIFSYTLWRVRISQHWTKSLFQHFYEIPIYTSVVSVFIEVQHLFLPKMIGRVLISLAAGYSWLDDHNFKMSVNLLESKLYLWKLILYFNTVLDQRSEFTVTFPQQIYFQNRGVAICNKVYYTYVYEA